MNFLSIIPTTRRSSEKSRHLSAVFSACGMDRCGLRSPCGRPVRLTSWVAQHQFSPVWMWCVSPSSCDFKAWLSILWFRRMVNALKNWGLEGSLRSFVVSSQVEPWDIILSIVSLPRLEGRSLLYLPLPCGPAMTSKQLSQPGRNWNCGKKQYNIASFYVDCNSNRKLPTCLPSSIVLFRKWENCTYLVKFDDNKMNKWERGGREREMEREIETGGWV